MDNSETLVKFYFNVNLLVFIECLDYLDVTPFLLRFAMFLTILLNEMEF